MTILDGNIFEGMRMIIPEHREAMVRMAKEEKRMEKPILDEDQLNEMSYLLSEAIQDERSVRVKVFKPFGPECIEMIPKGIDPYAKKLKGIDTKDTPITVPIMDLLEVSL